MYMNMYYSKSSMTYHTFWDVVDVCVRWLQFGQSYGKKKNRLGYGSEKITLKDHLSFILNFGH